MTQKKYWIVSMTINFELDDIVFGLVQSAKSEQLCTNFEDDYVKFQKLSEEDRIYVLDQFDILVRGLPTTTDEDILMYKMIIKRLKIERERSTKHKSKLDNYISKIGQTIINFRRMSIDRNHSYLYADFDWRYIYYRSKLDNLKTAREEYVKHFYSKQKISVFPKDQWIHVEENEIIDIHEVVEHYDVNNYKRYYVLYSDHDDSKKYIMELSKLRKEYELYELNIDFLHELFYDSSECNCECNDY